MGYSKDIILIICAQTLITIMPRGRKLSCYIDIICNSTMIYILCAPFDSYVSLAVNKIRTNYAKII